ncbi:hypothetical protein EK904_011202, partial [Melospiza melodia maxima]
MTGVSLPVNNEFKITCLFDNCKALCMLVVLNISEIKNLKRSKTGKMFFLPSQNFELLTLPSQRWHTLFNSMWLVREQHAQAGQALCLFSEPHWQLCLSSYSLPALKEDGSFPSVGKALSAWLRGPTGTGSGWTACPDP